jgi:RloB-like protein
MGSEDLFHKRKARAAEALERSQHTRARNLRYLIVCEGTKTEPHYFAELLNDLRIRAQSVRIAPNDGVSPDRVVAHALALYEEDACSGDSYDTVYCVFDRDKHTTFDGAVQRTRDLRNAEKPFEAITSTPCFEVWLLLHFGFTDQPFHSAGKKSVGDAVVAALKTKPSFNKYGKGQRGVYSVLKDSLDIAIEAAQRLRTQSAATGSVNPLTEVDILVSALRALAGK